MKNTARILAMTAALTVAASGSVFAQKQVVISGSNSQTVNVSGSISNEARSGAKAQVNIGSISGSKAKVGSNSQTVSVSGSIHNQASGSGSKAIINIGSVSDE
ncbi:MULTISPECIES: hypothetical protein [unclassified Lysobacter]